MPSLHYSFISYDNINLVQEQGSTQIAMSSTEMQSYINSTFLIRTVLLQLYVSLKLMFPSISAPLIGETTTQIILKQVKFRCNQMLFFFGGEEGGNVRIQRKTTWSRVVRERSPELYSNRLYSNRLYSSVHERFFVNLTIACNV